ncbi:uncharacterized protein B0H64DRAFT_31276 [Chaetomium fimeti]|uniref:Uncharacterized protein n=1 Tax=Chaetomium fimeti TaxID=1854472 RepID=A0AAE0LXJ9_9PEZI|nr:hypothetical protein B0H64DRAFT_31276 [Chaetomium fimeti]
MSRFRPTPTPLTRFALPRAVVHVLSSPRLHGVRASRVFFLFFFQPAKFQRTQDGIRLRLQDPSPHEQTAVIGGRGERDGVACRVARHLGLAVRLTHSGSHATPPSHLPSSMQLDGSRRVVMREACVALLPCCSPGFGSSVFGYEQGRWEEFSSLSPHSTAFQKVLPEF